MCRNDFDFVRIFFELFNNFYALPLSTTLVKFVSPVSLTLVKNYSPVPTTPVSDGFTGLTGVNDTGEGYHVCFNTTLVKLSFTGVNNASKAILYQCQRLQWNTAYAFWSAEIFKFKIDSMVSMIISKIPNLSDTEPTWYWTSGSEPIWYWTYLILNLSDTEPIGY